MISYSYGEIQDCPWGAETERLLQIRSLKAITADEQIEVRRLQFQLTMMVVEMVYWKMFADVILGRGSGLVNDRSYSPQMLDQTRDPRRAQPISRPDQRLFLSALNLRFDTTMSHLFDDSYAIDGPGHPFYKLWELVTRISQDNPTLFASHPRRTIHTMGRQQWVGIMNAVERIIGAFGAYEGPDDRMPSSMRDLLVCNFANLSTQHHVAAVRDVGVSGVILGADSGGLVGGEWIPGARTWLERDHPESEYSRRHKELMKHLATVDFSDALSTVSDPWRRLVPDSKTQVPRVILDRIIEMLRWNRARKEGEPRFIEFNGHCPAWRPRRPPKWAPWLPPILAAYREAQKQAGLPLPRVLKGDATATTFAEMLNVIEASKFQLLVGGRKLANGKELSIDDTPWDEMITSVSGEAAVRLLDQASADMRKAAISEQFEIGVQLLAPA